MFIFSMQPDNLAHDADDDSVTRSLEAYLLWLFGYIMFNNSHGAYVDRVLVPYALEIAEAAVEEMPQYSWGAAVLAATYRGLCKASVQNKHNAILTGCPILLPFGKHIVHILFSINCGMKSNYFCIDI